MNNKRNALLISAAIITLTTSLTFSACKTLSESENGNVAAILTNPSMKELQALNQQVTTLLGISAIRLSSDAFQKSSWLIIDGPQHKDPQGNLAIGNNGGRPDKVQLVIKNKQCILVHQATGKSTVLKDVNCTALAEK